MQKIRSLVFMEKTGKILVIAGLALGILTGSATSNSGILAPKQAKADILDPDEYYKATSGTFGKRQTGTKAFPKISVSNPKAAYILIPEMFITSSSAAKGNYVLEVQVRKSSKYAWKTIKSVIVPKNGKKNFSSGLIPNYREYRFLLTNTSTLKPIKFKIEVLEIIQTYDRNKKRL